MSERTWFIWKWGGVLGLIATVVAIPYLPGRTEPVTRERLAEAARLWEQAHITNYDLDLEVRGAQTGRYHVAVRDGTVVEILLNDQPASPAASEYYTIDGLFLTIEEELELSERLAKSDTARKQPVWLRMRCDRKLGYPVRYIGQIPGRPRGVEILVRRFRPSS
jgi:hypothetical protein